MTIDEFKDELRPHYGSFCIEHPSRRIRTNMIVMPGMCPLQVAFGAAWKWPALESGLTDDDIYRIWMAADGRAGADHVLRRWMEKTLVDPELLPVYETRALAGP